jgi:peptidoglycan/xylan/chitin deacetylase (PgdA/CDA1 family)
MTPRIARTIVAVLAGGMLLLAGCGGGATRTTARPGQGATTVPGASGGSATSPVGAPSAAVATERPEPVPAVLISAGDPKSKKVALTFDLCQVPGQPAGFDQGIFDALSGRGAKATFFMGGNWAETHQREAEILGGLPSLFEIGNHAYAHKHPTRISSAAFAAEVTRAQAEIQRYAGARPVLFRFPYGEWNDGTLKQVSAMGLKSIQWNVETGDPDKGVSAKAILGVVRSQAKGGSIIIMHANGRGRNTAEALPGVIDWLRAQGYELVTVSELLAGR